MTESILPRHEENHSSPIQTWMRRLVWKIAIATLLLMAVGSATRVMNAGLACPDWPLCYGQWIPSQQMNLQVFLEWFHRLDAALIGFSTLGLVGLSIWFRRSLPAWLPWASVGALGLILFQGVLGGLTVTQLLRFDIVTAHLGTALLFFASLIAIALCLQPKQPFEGSGYFRGVAIIATVFVYLQCLLGGLVGSRWAVHQCLNVALTELCSVMNSHLIGVIPATLATLILIVMTLRNPSINPIFQPLALTLAGLITLQILLGVATLRLHLQVEPLTVAHHLIGASLFGTLVAFTTLALRNYQPNSDRPSVPHDPTLITSDSL
ncbi:MAG: heme A synthase [Snowella sp.]|nr:heme A synthase [Snowella sp.]